jgi:phage FluMu gp28-like protein
MYSPDEVVRYADAFLKYNDVPIELDLWQEMFLKDQSQFLILLKGRQEGFSFAVAAKKLIELQSPDVVNKTVQFVSYNLADAVEKIRYASIMAHGIPEKHRKKIKYETKTGIEFADKNGKTTSRLISIACRPPRGKPGDIVLDEAAIYGSRKSKDIYTAALPSITWGGTMIIGSTPLGKLGIFYDIYSGRENYPDYVRYLVPWWKSGKLCVDIDGARKAGIKDMLTEDRVKLWGTRILKQEFAALDILSFQQEFECVFIDSAESYIPLDLIYANTPGMRDTDRAKPFDDTYEGGEIIDDLEVTAYKTADEVLLGYDPAIHGDRLFLGYDVARRRDAAVIFLIGLLPNGKKRSVANIEMVNKTFEYQRDEVRKLMKRLPVCRGAIDKGGMGEDTTEILQREFTATVLEGVMFNNAVKEELAMGVKEGLEKNEFMLQNDNKFHRQIHSIKRMATSGGNVRYDSERDEDGHADSFWAWALADYAIPKADAKEDFYSQYRKRRNAEIQKMQGDIVDNAGAVAAPIKRGKSALEVLRKAGLK